MISRTLGAPLGGTRRGGHQVFDPCKVSLRTPPNGGGGAGSWLPGTVVVALGEPTVPVVCCAITSNETVEPRRKPNDSNRDVLLIVTLPRRSRLAESAISGTFRRPCHQRRRERGEACTSSIVNGAEFLTRCPARLRHTDVVVRTARSCRSPVREGSG